MNTSNTFSTEMKNQSILLPPLVWRQRCSQSTADDAGEVHHVSRAAGDFGSSLGYLAKGSHRMIHRL